MVFLCSVALAVVVISVLLLFCTDTNIGKNAISEADKSAEPISHRGLLWSQFWGNSKHDNCMPVMLATYG